MSLSGASGAELVRPECRDVLTGFERLPFYRYIRKKYMSPRPLPDSTSLLSGRQPPQLPPTLQATRDHIPLRRSPTPGGSLSTSATPVFGRVLEHRPTTMSDASTGGTSAMRRGRPTPSSSSSSTGLVNTFSPPSHAPPPPPRATIQQQQVQQQSSTASAGGYNPSMGFAVSLQQQQQKQQPASTPPHGPWSDLLSLSQSQPQPPQHAPIPQLQQQQASSSLAPALAPFPNLQQQQSFTGMSVAGGQPAVYDQSPAAYGLASQQFVQQQQQPMPSQSIFGQQRQAPPMGMYGQQPQLSPYHTQPQLLQQQSFSQSQPALYGQPQQAGPVGNGGAVSFMQGMMPTRQLGVQFPPQQQQQQQYGGGPYGPGGW